MILTYNLKKLTLRNEQSVKQQVLIAGLPDARCSPLVTSTRGIQTKINYFLTLEAAYKAVPA